MVECEYCGKDVKSRGYKNHVRMSGEPHGAQGEMPADDDTSEEREPASEDADADGDSSVTEVSPNEFEADVSDSETTEDGSDESGSKYPFDPNDDDAVELSGDEELIVVGPDGELTYAYPDKGDWLLIADDGKPYLYEDGTGDLYEVKTE